jgi:large subunit ribosomal protein L21
MYAIIEESGAQRRVAENDEFLIDLHNGGQGSAGESITYDRVLLVGEPGGKAKIGRPYVDGASVSVEIVEPEVKGEKIHIYKFKPKSGYSRKTGHRQRYTAVKVTSIKG